MDAYGEDASDAAAGIVHVVSQLQYTAGDDEKPDTIQRLAFDEDHSLLVVVGLKSLSIYTFVDENLTQVSSRDFKGETVFLEYIPSRSCFLHVWNGTNSDSPSTATVLCVQHTKPKRRHKVGADVVIEPRGQVNNSDGEYQIDSPLSVCVAKSDARAVDAAFNHTSGELAVALATHSSSDELETKAEGRGINVYCLRHSKNSKKAPYRLTQRLEISSAPKLAYSIAFDEILGHIVALCSEGTVCMWDQEQGILKESMTGLLKHEYRPGGLFIGYHNSLTLTFPLHEVFFEAWTEEFQCTCRASGLLSSTVGFATATSNLRPPKIKKDAHGPAAFAPPTQFGEDDIIAATIDSDQQVNCWHVTDEGVRQMASLSLGSNAQQIVSSPGRVAPSHPSLCFLRRPPEQGNGRGELYLVVASRSSMMLLQLHDPRGSASCLQQVATFRATAASQQLSIESKPPLSAGCDPDNEAILFGSIYSSGDGSASRAEQPAATKRRPSARRAASAVARPAVISGPVSQRLLTVSTHGSLRSSGLASSMSMSHRSKLPPHSRIGVGAAIASQARVTRAFYSSAMSCTLIGWNTGFVDVVNVPQGARLRTLAPVAGPAVLASLPGDSEQRLNDAKSISSFAVVPRHGNPVGERLQRAVVLAGLKNGEMSAWSLSSFDSDTIEAPDRAHSSSIVDILTWSFPAHTGKSTSSSDVVATTVIVTGSENGEVKIWSVECVETSSLKLATTTGLRRRSSSRSLGSRPGTSQSRGSRPSSSRPVSSATKPKLRWAVRAFFRATTGKKRQRLTSLCQLSFTTLVLGFEGGTVQRWRLPEIQMSAGAKITTATAPLQSMKLHSDRVTSLSSSVLEDVSAAAHRRRGYQWMLSGSSDCTIVLSHLVVADNSSTTQMELQPLKVFLLSEPVYGVFCHSSSNNQDQSQQTTPLPSSSGQRSIIGITAHHALKLPWPAKWQKRGSEFFRFNQVFYASRRRAVAADSRMTFPRSLQPFREIDLPTACKLYLAPRGKLFETAIPAHQKRLPKPVGQQVPSSPKPQLDAEELRKAAKAADRKRMKEWQAREQAAEAARIAEREAQAAKLKADKEAAIANGAREPNMRSVLVEQKRAILARPVVDVGGSFFGDSRGILVVGGVVGNGRASEKHLNKQSRQKRPGHHIREEAEAQLAAENAARKAAREKFQRMEHNILTLTDNDRRAGADTSTSDLITVEVVAPKGFDPKALTDAVNGPHSTEATIASAEARAAKARARAAAARKAAADAVAKAKREDAIAKAQAQQSTVAETPELSDSPPPQTVGRHLAVSPVNQFKDSNRHQESTNVNYLNMPGHPTDEEAIAGANVQQSPEQWDSAQWTEDGWVDDGRPQPEYSTVTPQLPPQKSKSSQQARLNSKRTKKAKKAKDPERPWLASRPKHDIDPSELGMVIGHGTMVAPGDVANSRAARAIAASKRWKQAVQSKAQALQHKFINKLKKAKERKQTKLEFVPYRTAKLAAETIVVAESEPNVVSTERGSLWKTAEVEKSEDSFETSPPSAMFAITTASTQAVSAEDRPPSPAAEPPPAAVPLRSPEFVGSVVLPASIPTMAKPSLPLNYPGPIPWAEQDELQRNTEVTQSLFTHNVQVLAMASGLFEEVPHPDFATSSDPEHRVIFESYVDWYSKNDEAREETYWRHLELLHEDESLMEKYWTQLDGDVKLAALADAKQQEAHAALSGHLESESDSRPATSSSSSRPNSPPSRAASPNVEETKPRSRSHSRQGTPASRQSSRPSSPVLHNIIRNRSRSRSGSRSPRASSRPKSPFSPNQPRRPSTTERLAMEVRKKAENKAVNAQRRWALVRDWFRSTHQRNFFLAGLGSDSTSSGLSEFDGMAGQTIIEGLCGHLVLENADYGSSLQRSPRQELQLFALRTTLAEALSTRDCRVSSNQIKLHHIDGNRVSYLVHLLSEQVTFKRALAERLFHIFSNQKARDFYRKLFAAEDGLKLPGIDLTRKMASVSVRGFTRALRPVLSGGIVFRGLDKDGIENYTFQSAVVDTFLARAQRACDLEAVAQSSALQSSVLPPGELVDADDATVAEAAVAVAKAALNAARAAKKAAPSADVSDLEAVVPRLNPSDVQIRNCHADGSLNFVVQLDKFADPKDPSQRVRQHLRSVVAATKHAFHLILNDTSGRGLVLLLKRRCREIENANRPEGQSVDSIGAAAVVRDLFSTSGYITETEEWRVSYQTYSFGVGQKSPYGIDVWDKELDDVEAGLHDLEVIASVLAQKTDHLNDRVPKLRRVASLLTAQMNMLREYRKTTSPDANNKQLLSTPVPNSDELQQTLGTAEDTIDLMKSLNASSADVGALFGMSVREFRKAIEQRHTLAETALVKDLDAENNDRPSSAFNRMQQAVTLESRKKVERKRQQRQRALVEWYQNNPSVIEEFALRNPDTISLRVFVRPVHGAYFFITQLDLNQKTHEMLAAMCDKRIRAECMFQNPDLDTNDISLLQFDHDSWIKVKNSGDGKSHMWRDFQRWFQAPARAAQTRRFDFIQREVACVTAGGAKKSEIVAKYEESCGKIAAMAVDTDALHFCEWYEEQEELRTKFLAERVAMVKEYITWKEKDRRLDLLADGEPYDPDELRIWDMYPEIDIFDLDFDEKMEKVREANKPRPKPKPIAGWIVDAWERFVLEYHLNKKRWWLTCTFAVDPHDDHIMQEADRAQRETNLMMQEDADQRRIRAEHLRYEALCRQREIMDMMEEDRLARMLRDQCIYFTFLGTMSTKTDRMDPSKMRAESPTQRGEWRFKRGLGIDNNDELYDQQREAEEEERQQMAREEEQTRTFVKEKEEEDKAIAITKGDAARRERLSNERNSRLWQLVVQQRREDRERRDDPDGMTKAEREAFNNDALSREESLERMRLEMSRVANLRAESVARNTARLEKIAEEARIVAAVAAEEEEHKRKQERLQELEETEQMAQCDAESAAAAVAATENIEKDAAMAEALAPFTPYYPDDSDGGFDEEASRAWMRNEQVVQQRQDARKHSEKVSGEAARRARKQKVREQAAKHIQDKEDTIPNALKFRQDPTMRAMAAVMGSPAPPSGYADQGGGPGDRLQDLGLDEPEDAAQGPETDLILRHDAELKQKLKTRKLARRLSTDLLLRDVKQVEFVSLPDSPDRKLSQRDRRDGGRGAPAAAVLMPASVKRRDAVARARQVRNMPPASDVNTGVSGEASWLQTSPKSRSPSRSPTSSPKRYQPHTKEELDEKWNAKFDESRAKLRPDPALIPFNHGAFGILAQKKPLRSKEFESRKSAK